MSRQDALTTLTIAELDSGSRQLKADLVGAITEGTADKSKALAIVSWLHARRAEPAAKLSDHLAMTYSEVTEQLAAHITDDGDADEDDLSPTEPAPGP